MKTTKMLTILFLAGWLMLWAGQAVMAGTVGTAFTYQGRLIDANVAADGLYDFQFKLYDTNSDGNKVGTDVNLADVDVIDGYFTVELDFGADPNSFNGDERWLDIGVRPGDLDDPNIYTVLSPRQVVTPAPYAIHALSGGESLWRVNGSDIYYNNGNVGIGTSNPQGLLQIGEPIIVTVNTYLSGVEEDIGISDSIDPEYTPDAKLEISSGGTGRDLLMLSSYPSGDGDLLIVKNSGKVGIGTTTPSSPLTIKTVAGPDIELVSTGSNADIMTNAAFKVGTTTSQPFSIITNNLYQMTVDSTGNVGLGTISPSTKLEVAGQVKITGGSPEDGKVLTSDSTGLATWQTLTETDPTVIASVKDGVSWGEVSDIPAGFADGIDDVGAGDNLGNHIATQNIQLNGHWLSGDGGSEGVYVANTGNVGIGTTTPSDKLSVYGGTIRATNSDPNGYTFIGEAGLRGGVFSASSVGGVGVFGWASHPSEWNAGGYFGTDSNAGVGIHCTASGDYAGGIYTQASGQASSGIFSSVSHPNGVTHAVWGACASPNGYAGYFTGGRNYFSGNVGIGTMNPSAKLEVNGNIKTIGIYETYTSNIWIPVESNRDWTSVAMSADGTKQTAVVNEWGPGGQIYVSTDSGSTWTPKESNRDWMSVAMSSDGTKQTAVVNNGQIYVSTDSGNTWTAKESNREWTNVAMSANGTKQTAVVYDGLIYVSTDSGNTWAARGLIGYWRSVAMSADGIKQTAVVDGGQIYISTDSGNNWTAKESNRNWISVAMSADGTIQTTVVHPGKIYVSTDSGNTWTPKESNRTWFGVAMSADGTIQIAVVDGGQIYVSTDSGNTWAAKESIRDWKSVAMSADGTKQTAVVNGGQIYISNMSVGIGTTNPAGTLDVSGSIYQRGSLLHADYVFEPDYKLESIDEHSEFMWQEKHLPAMPKMQKDENGREIVEIGARSKGIVEELEKAHIYIEQLNKENKELQAKLTMLDARLDAMETMVAKSSLRMEGGIK
jgi:hypothetical protein